jgi:hypothetical protein
LTRFHPSCRPSSIYRNLEISVVYITYPLGSEILLGHDLKSVGRLT